MSGHTAKTPRLTDREDIARRLLRGSAKASFDPLVEIDWDAPVEDLWGMRPERVSLYGTHLWDRLTDAERRRLSRLEMASTMATGIWFETILMQMLVRHAYHNDPTTNHVQYAYTEIADECRHTVMFARAVGKLGSRAHRLDPAAHFLGRVFKALAHGPLIFGGALFVEEILDQLQREMIGDEEIEPVVRATSRIHVIEEARHIRYAREEFHRDWAARGPLDRAYSRVVLGLVTYYSATRLVHRKVYAQLGLDPREAARAARRNPRFIDSKTHLSRKAVRTLGSAGAISGPGAYFWRRAGLLGR
ncbi:MULTISPECIES: AurF N-oxygenase family protein [Nocardiopsidaceae]|uniref:Diiron oxygenase n=1 Tax=Streptomonospora nanhaiensis TaxID=1323731 RepID=A0ABY6YJC3_9ACTN|nr:diiron oxygenase [Streptomonospora nanhaiensis]WAE72415.1 diiron oxygenase [Streptomonospora nanhaiensis]